MRPEVAAARRRVQEAAKASGNALSAATVRRVAAQVDRTTSDKDVGILIRLALLDAPETAGVSA